mgnify:FL=1|tara:strand:- start:1469 stop:3373 length:1905 start_codon:yes stop_codon:yes gene_type:complete
MAGNDNFFNRLTRLFRSGPLIKRKVKATRAPNMGSLLQQFQKSQSHVYSNAISAYGMYDRMSRYADFQEMESTPEISSALDIYSDESSSQDDIGKTLHIYSENDKIRQSLEELFYDNLNIDFNLNPWVRNLCKYGDFFLFLDIAPETGVLNGIPVPVNEIEREEGFDPEDPMAVRFRWITQGNRVLENWQIAHFRLLGNDAFLPYGSSVIEPARRIWRQLILIEDAMLVYRVIRSPERRVFKIDVGNVPPEDVANYMEQAKTSLRSSQVLDKNTGRVDLRYNPLSVDEDYFLPVRGQQDGTSIDTLAGGQNTTAIEDVEYIQKKLFAALKVPKAYLGYDEALSSKATLAQEDIRFSRTIAKIQRVLVSELNKIAAIHLYSNGFDGSDLIDFSLKLSNPSTIAQQQKLELFRTKFEIAASSPEGMLSRDYLRKRVLGLTNEEIDQIEKQRDEDKLRDLEVEAITLPGGPNSDDDLAGLGGEEESFEDDTAAPEDLEAGESPEDDKLLLGTDDAEEEVEKKSKKSGGKPLKANPAVSSKKPAKPRKANSAYDGRVYQLRPPESTSYTSSKKDRYIGNAAGDREVILGTDLRFESQETKQNQMTSQLKKTLKSLEKSIGSTAKTSTLIVEGDNNDKA